MSDSVSSTEPWVEEISVDPANLDSDLEVLGWRRTGELGVADNGQAMLSPDKDMVHVRNSEPFTVESIKAEVEEENPGMEVEPQVLEMGRQILEWGMKSADEQYREAGFEKLERI